MARSGAEHGRDRRPRGKLSHNPLFVGIVSALIAGTCTLVGGYIAGANHVISGGPGPRVTITVYRPAPSATGHGSSTPNHAGQMLFQKTGVQLSECYALRFTDPSLSPYKVNGCFTSPVGDLSVDVSGQVESAQQLAVIAGGAGYSQCRTDTTYVAQGISANANGPLTHQTLCITTGNRIAVC